MPIRDDADLPRIHRSESSRELRARAHDLRRTSTPPEDLLWQALRDRRFHGLKFRRQRPIGSFIADFYCVEQRLVVEVDGASHREPDARDRDAMRDSWMQGRNLRIVRISASLLLRDMGRALAMIERALASEAGRALTPGPSPAGAGEGSPQ